MSGGKCDVYMLENWANVTNEQRRDTVGMGAAAAWSLKERDSMVDYVSAMKGDSIVPFIRPSFPYIEINSQGP